MTPENKATADSARFAARLADVPMGEDRLEAVAAAFNKMLPSLDNMMKLELSDVEPAPVFQHAPR